MNRSTQFSPRAWMEMAVQEMLKSEHEQRTDGKVPPSVGAVLVTTAGNIHRSYRGQLGDGDHAESVLLERVSRLENIAGSKLLCTLEPCAPNARKSTKLSCGEQIALAKVAEIWIGMEDPDPLVYRKGIQYLEAHGITVRMFDRDLQDAIESENRDFIVGALSRAAKHRNPRD